MSLPRISCGINICIAVLQNGEQLYLAKSEIFASCHKAEHHEVPMKLPLTFLRNNNSI